MIVVVVLAAIVAPGGPRDAGAAHPPTSAAPFGVRTIATQKGLIAAFAHNDRHLAWITDRGALKCGALVMQKSRSAIRRSADLVCDDVPGGSPDSLVLAGNRAYWGELGSSNLTEYSLLMTAKFGARRAKELGFQSIAQGGFDHLVAPASDGQATYFWTSPEDATAGPIVRYVRLRARRVTSTVLLGALGAGEGRYAFARPIRSFDCAAEPAWSTGGHIAFASDDPWFWYRGRRRCRGGLWVVNDTGVGLHRIAAEGRNPDWSPDGAQLAYDARGAIIVSSDAGTNARTIVERGSDPAWSPDGSKLAFTRDQSLFVAAADGSGESLVLSGAVQPDWSPDGSELVFARTDKNNLGLGIVGVDGSSVRSLTTGYDGHPAWSPDGKAIAFDRCFNAHAACPRDASKILVVAPSGSDARVRMSEGEETYDLAPAWSPDSRRLVFMRARDWEHDGDPHLFILAKRVTRLTRTPDPQTPIVVRSRAGRTVARLDPQGEALELAVTRRLTAAITRSGGAGWRLEIFPPKPQQADKIPGRASSLSASGSLIVYRIGRQIMFLHARTGWSGVVTRAASRPIGLSILGRQIAWAENVRGNGRVRAVTVPGWIARGGTR